MRPVNSKSLFHMLCATLEKLDNGEIDVATASATAKLVGQCNNLLMQELKRAVILSNPEYENIHRDLELKKFKTIDNS